MPSAEIVYRTRETRMHVHSTGQRATLAFAYLHTNDHVHRIFEY